MKNGIERRRHLRAPIALDVVIVTPRGSFKGKTANISIGGLALLLFLEPPEVGDTFQATLSPTKGHEMSVTCEKIWSGKVVADDSVYIGIGIRFVKISSEDRKIIASLVKQYYLV